jgi:hypothetical protein
VKTAPFITSSPIPIPPGWSAADTTDEAKGRGDEQCGRDTTLTRREVRDGTGSASCRSFAFHPGSAADPSSRSELSGSHPRSDSEDLWSSSPPLDTVDLDLPPDDFALDPHQELVEDVTAVRFDDLPSSRPVKVQTKGVTPQKSQRELWAPQTIHRLSLAVKLRAAGHDEDADKLEHCHTQITVARCASCGTGRKFLNRCDLFFCPSCQPRLSFERRKSVEWWAERIDQPKHVVLTVRNTDTITKQHVVDLKEAFTRLRRSKLCRHWRGGFYSVEITNEGRGWHLHLHVLVDCKWIPADQLAIGWEKATRGAGYIVKVKDCRRADYLAEVTKYAVKGSQLAGWPAEDCAAFVTAFRGVRTFGVFGLLYKARHEWRAWLDSLQSEKSVCPCGSTHFVFESEGEYEWWTETHDPPAQHPVVCAPVAPVAHPEFPLQVPARFVSPD